MEYVILAVLIAGIVLRITYMLYTPFSLRTHDLLAYNKGAGDYAYMYKLFQNWSLPNSYANQFYHPPFQFIAQVIAVKISALLQPNATMNTVFDASKLIPCFASCAVLWVSYSLTKAVCLSKNATLIALCIIAFHPAFFILSAFVNNDAVMLLFFFTAALYTIRWYYNPTYKNIILIALSVGLSMMTKLSGGVIALFIAPVYIWVLIKKLRAKQGADIFAQFGIFVSISVPLGIWYSIRNFVLFAQPFGYVPRIGSTSNLYCGGHTIFERFLSFPLDKVFNPLYCQPRGDYNLWIYVLKCSVFGEYKYNAPTFIACALLLANIVIIVLSLIAMVYVMVSCKQLNKFVRFGLFFIWLVQMASFIAFNLRYPFGCTMDFRYIMPTCIVGAVYIGTALDHWEKKNKLLYKGFFYAGCLVCVFFCLASVLFFGI